MSEPVKRMVGDAATDPTLVRARVEQILFKRYGRCDEDLVAAGLVDSLKTIELALELERQFGVSFDEIGVSEMTTVSGIVRWLMECGPQREGHR